MLLFPFFSFFFVLQNTANDGVGDFVAESFPNSDTADDLRVSLMARLRGESRVGRVEVPKATPNMMSISLSPKITTVNIV